MTTLTTFAQVEKAIVDRFATMWEGRNLPYALENDGFEPDANTAWALLLFRYASNRNLAIGQVTRKQRQGVFIAQIHAPKNTGVKQMTELEDAIIAEFESHTRTGQVKFSDQVPTRIGIREEWLRSDVSIIFRWDHHA